MFRQFFQHNPSAALTIALLREQCQMLMDQANSEAHVTKIMQENQAVIAQLQARLDSLERQAMEPARRESLPAQPSGMEQQDSATIPQSTEVARFVDAVKSVVASGTKPPWAGSLKDYGLQNSTPDSELEEPLEKWAKRVLIIKDQCAVASLTLNRAIYQAIKHPAVKMDNDKVFDLTPEQLLNSLQEDVKRFHDKNFSIVQAREKGQSCVDYLKHLQRFIARLSVIVTDGWYIKHLKAQTTCTNFPNVEGKSLMEIFQAEMMKSNENIPLNLQKFQWPITLH